jgi:hypothetical protein
MVLLRVTLKPFSIFLTLALLCVSPAAGDIINYDASVLPDDPSISGKLTYYKSASAAWSTDGSVLTMTPAATLSNVWIGWSESSIYSGRPNWSFAPNNLGNKITLTCKVSPESEYFTFGFGDGAYQGGMAIKDGLVRFYSTSGEYMYVPLDTTVLHTYSILRVGEMSTYSIDGTDYAGGSTPLTDTYLYIGDFAGTPLASMYVDDVTIVTAVPEPPAIALFSVLALIGGAVVWRKRSCRDE